MSQFSGSIRIVSLPAGHTSVETVKVLVEDILQIGKTSNIKVQQRNHGATTYYTAFIDLEQWFETPVAQLLGEQLACLEDDRSFILDSPTFSWANGKSMNLSFKALTAVKVALKPQPVYESTDYPLSDTDWKSMYIPCIPENMFVVDKLGGQSYPFHQDQLKWIIEQGLGVGEVSRIDFVRNIKEDGSTVLSAYVHFKKWHDNSFVENLRNELNTSGSKRIHYFGQYSFHRSLDIASIQRAFLVFKINHKPIEEAPADINVHQAMAAAKFLDAKVKEQEAEIAKLKEMLGLGVDGKGPMTIDELATEDA